MSKVPLLFKKVKSKPRFKVININEWELEEELNSISNDWKVVGILPSHPDFAGSPSQLILERIY